MAEPPFKWTYRGRELVAWQYYRRWNYGELSSLAWMSRGRVSTLTAAKEEAEAWLDKVLDAKPVQRDRAALSNKRKVRR
ncbi:MAG TPA: hypothetical protein VG269_12300 [Tepidisphaeraceae bacterium]|jgi:hypothetical protein|nr:hypothetical protein [Tepidisphaeraceae bacterium]